MAAASRRPPGPLRKYERIVSASTRRLPSTTMDETVCAATVRAARTETAPEPNTVPPRTTHTTASPRSIPTQRSIRYAPHLFSVGPPGDRRILPPGLYNLFPAPQLFLADRITFWLQGVAGLPRPIMTGICERDRLPAEHPPNVIIGREQHQHEHDRKADAEPDLLGAIGQRPATSRLEAVEQKMTAVEQRDREQVEQADRDRDRRRPADENVETEPGCLARHHRNTDRPAELIRGLEADDHAAQVLERAVDDRPALVNS